MDRHTVAVNHEDRQPILLHDFEIALDRLQGACACFLDRLALEPYGGDREWRQLTWGAIIALYGRYPDHLKGLKIGW